MAAAEKKRIHLIVGKLSCVAVLMFAFALWVMPPLYDLICDIAGLNGKTGERAEAVAVEVDKSRVITVQFVAINNENMPWDFEPEEFSLKVHPGEYVVTHFNATNPTGHIMVGQAVPSMVPSNATDYFFKTECFCFNKQVLAPSESAELGLQFVIDQAIPRSVSTITLSYSLFDVTDMSPEDVEKRQRVVSEQQAAARKQRQYQPEVDVNKDQGLDKPIILTANSK